MYQRIFILLIFFNLFCANRANDNELLPLLALNSASSTKVLIIGDSLTSFSNGFYLNEYLNSGYQVEYKSALNRDIPYWSSRVPEALATTGNPPDIIIFPMGTNDAFSFFGDRFLENVNEFHSKLRNYSSANIFYCKVPRTKDPALILNILENNELLQNNLPSGNVGLIDLDSPLENSTGSELLYDIEDPLHPTQAGFRLMGRAMQTSIESTSF